MVILIETNQGRIRWIDIAKAIAISLVVFGHTMRGGSVQKVVYSFHVAAFFFLAGLTCKTNGVRARIKSDFFRIMVPYYCFGIISIAVFAVLGTFAAAKFDMNINPSFGANIQNLLYANSKGGALQFNTPLWFLPCLFATKLLYYAIDRACSGKTGYVIMVSIILAGASFVYNELKLPYPPFSLTVALKMLPLFTLGRVFFLYAQSAGSCISSRPVMFGIGVALLSITCVAGFYAPSVNYSGDTFPNGIAFYTTALLGSIGICFFSMGIEHNPLLEYIGKNTLPILVMHKFPIVLFQTVGPLANILTQADTVIGNLCGGVPVTLLSIVMSLTVATIIKRVCPFLIGIRRQKTNT